jgi:hypothetical protein
LTDPEIGDLIETYRRSKVSVDDLAPQPATLARLAGRFEKRSNQEGVRGVVPLDALAAPEARFSHQTG